MALSEASAALAIERLGAADIAAALALSDAAGWNQTADDWAFFLHHGRTLGCRDDGGRLVATAAALPYGAACGWISMVLVAAGWRHRGLATALLDEAVAGLRADGRVAVLDATPAGAPVYRRLGFGDGFAFERWQGEGGERLIAGEDGDGEAARQVRLATPADHAALIDAAAAATGLDRAALLRDVLGRSATRAWLVDDGDHGCLIARAGRRATQIGPIAASSAAQATALLAAALAASPGEIFIDVPTGQAELATWLQRRGFTRQRPFLRMALGGDVPPSSASAFAFAGPEFG